MSDHKDDDRNAGAGVENQPHQNNGKATQGVACFNASEPDRSGKRTIIFSIDDKELCRDLFNPDSRWACDKFAQMVAKRAPRGFVQWACRQHLSLADDHYVSEPDEPFAEYARGRIFAGIAKDAGAAAGDSRAFNRITAAELATTTYDIEFHIPGILVAGQPQGIFGAKKSLKTSLMLDQAIAIATGGLWLGYFHVAKPARVAVFTGESGMATIQETCLRICRAAGVKLEDTGIVFSDTLPQIGQPGDMAAWEKFLTADEIELVYVDPAYLAMLTAGNEGSIFHMGSMLRSMSEMCRRIGVTPVLLHHMKSTVVDPYRPGDLDDASWAGFAEFVRGWTLINRREKYVPGTGEHKLLLSVGGSVGHGGLYPLDINEGRYTGPGSRTWDVQVLSADEVREAAEEGKSKVKAQQKAERIDRDVKALVQAAAKFPSGESKNILRDCTGLSGDRCNAALAIALDRGHLVPCDVFKSGKKTPIEGYQLPPKAPQP